MLKCYAASGLPKHKLTQKHLSKTVHLRWMMQVSAAAYAQLMSKAGSAARMDLHLDDINSQKLI